MFLDREDITRPVNKSEIEVNKFGVFKVKDKVVRKRDLPLFFIINGESRISETEGIFTLNIDGHKYEYITRTGEKSCFKKNGLLHRADGPATITPAGPGSKYAFNGAELSKREWLKAAHKNNKTFFFAKGLKGVCYSDGTDELLAFDDFEILCEDEKNHYYNCDSDSPPKKYIGWLSNALGGAHVKYGPTATEITPRTYGLKKLLDLLEDADTVQIRGDDAHAKYKNGDRAFFNATAERISYTVYDKDFCIKDEQEVFIRASMTKSNEINEYKLNGVLVTEGEYKTAKYEEATGSYVWKDHLYRKHRNGPWPAEITKEGEQKYYIHGVQVNSEQMNVYNFISNSVKVRNSEGNLHCESGPAYMSNIGEMGCIEKYYLDGVLVSEDEWAERIARKKKAKEAEEDLSVYGDVDSEWNWGNVGHDLDFKYYHTESEDIANKYGFGHESIFSSPMRKYYKEPLENTIRVNDVSQKLENKMGSSRSTFSIPQPEVKLTQSSNSGDLTNSLKIDNSGTSLFSLEINDNSTSTLEKYPFYTKKATQLHLPVIDHAKPTVMKAVKDRALETFTGAKLGLKKGAIKGAAKLTASKALEKTDFEEGDWIHKFTEIMLTATGAEALDIIPQNILDKIKLSKSAKDDACSLLREVAGEGIGRNIIEIASEVLPFFKEVLLDATAEEINEITNDSEEDTDHEDDQEEKKVEIEEVEHEYV